VAPKEDTILRKFLVDVFKVVVGVSLIGSWVGVHPSEDVDQGLEQIREKVAARLKSIDSVKIQW